MRLRPLELSLACAAAMMAPTALAQTMSDARFEQRLKALLDTNEIERFHNVYGYQQDKSLFFENIELFADKGSVGIFQNAEYREKAGLERLWYGHWAHLSHYAFVPVDGLLNDHIMFQPVVTLAPDGQTATLRGRGRGYITSYQETLKGQGTKGFDDHFVDASGKQASTGHLALIQDYIYENRFVKEGGAWKLQRWNICIYATGTYGRGYADMPVAGTMGNPDDAKPGARRRLDLEEGQPERSQDLFPENAMGPDRVLTPEESGCFVAKNQIMSRSSVVPFSFVNPVNGRPVRWVNR